MKIVLAIDFDTCHSLHMKIKTLFKRFLGLFPSELPTGMAAFDAWVGELVSTYPMPTTDADSIKFVLASIILRLGPQTAYKSKFYFYLTLKAGASKQVAGECFQQIKLKQQAEQQAENK